jgi:hypothetical protein
LSTVRQNFFYEEKCDDEVFATLHPKVICLRDLDSERIVREHQLSAYTLLPTTSKPHVHLLKQALKEMHEYYDQRQFVHRVTWFESLMRRTKTMTDEEKFIIEEELRMQYQYDTLLTENPTIMQLVSKSLTEGKVEGKAEGLQEAILELASDRFPTQIVTQVQQVIVPAHNADQLKKFLRLLARASDEQEVQALLMQCFPQEGKIEGLQEAILDMVSDSFSYQIVEQVRQAITPCRSAQQLRAFHRKLVRLSDEQDVLALLAECFPHSEEY